MLIKELLEKSSALTLNTDLSPTEAPSFDIQGVSELKLAGPHDLILISKRNHVDELAQSKAKAIVYQPSLRSHLPSASNKIFLEASNFSQLLSEILPFFLPPEPEFAEGPTSIHPTAKIGKNVRIFPFVVVGAHAEIGDDVVLGPHTVVGSKAVVGPRTRLVSHVHIGDRCVVGADCIFHPHVCLGADGFGFWMNKEGVHKKVPQIGNVVIENSVELGSFVGIDRATLGSTYIREGTKLDNFCHIAHNCDIGAHSIGAGGFMVAGSCKIGHHFMAGGGTHIGDHVHIAENVTLAGRTGVTGSIDTPGVYGGFPIQPIKEYLKTMNNIKQITEMRKNIKKILQHLGLKDESPS